MKNLMQKLSGLTIFSIAMGFMETAVVIYLRKIYYPEGFDFPLVKIDKEILIVEIFREAATMIMLIMTGMFLGKTRLQRFSFFIFSFAVWDICYYVFLKIFLDWPESFLTPDILFLLPVPWVGPVITPVILSVSMIILSLTILHSENRNQVAVVNGMDWKLLIAGSVVAIISFVINYVKSLDDVIKNSSPFFLDEITGISPDFTAFNWLIFVAGEIMILSAIIRISGKRYAI